MPKFIGHYKSVDSPDQFYSIPRQELDFPTQVIKDNKSYLLFTTIQVSTSSQENKLHELAKQKNITMGVVV